MADKRGELLRLRSQEEKTSEAWGGVEGEALQTLVNPLASLHVTLHPRCFVVWQGLALFGPTCHIDNIQVLRIESEKNFLCAPATLYFFTQD